MVAHGAGAVSLGEDADPALAALAEFRPGRAFALESLGGTVWRARPEGGGAWLVVKCAGPSGAAQLAQQARRLRQVWRHLRDDALARVPRPWHLTADGTALVMEDALGRQAALAWWPAMEFDLCLRQLQRFGDWIGAFHAPTLQGVAFDPGPHLRWLARIEAPTDDLAAPGLLAAARAADGKPALQAVTHRDLHLKNLILRQGGAVFGLDFENGKPDVALRDPLMLLVDAALRGGFDRDAMLLARAAAALWRGYRARIGPTLPQAPEAALFFQRFHSTAALARLGAPEGEGSRRRAELHRMIQALHAPLFADH